MLHAPRRPSSASPRSVFLPRSQGSMPPRIYGQRLELAEGTSLRELPCHCADKAGKPSKSRRGFVPSVSQRRRCLSLSSALPSRSGCAQVQRHCSSSWRSVCVLWATTFKFCRQQRDYAAGISSLMLFRVGSRPSLPPSPLFRLNSLRVCAVAAPLPFILGECLFCFGRPPSSFAANNETLRQASANLCS
jgi:hypothetical protein